MGFNWNLFVNIVLLPQIGVFYNKFYVLFRYLCHFHCGVVCIRHDCTLALLHTSWTRYQMVVNIISPCDAQAPGELYQRINSDILSSKSTGMYQISTILWVKWDTSLFLETTCPFLGPLLWRGWYPRLQMGVVSKSSWWYMDLHVCAKWAALLHLYRNLQNFLPLPEG